MKIYTRTGDSGETSLFSGKRVAKNDPFIEAIGTVDEANCFLGFALSQLPRENFFSNLREQLEMIQHALFDVGAALATPRSSSHKHQLKKTHFDEDAVAVIEGWIDAMEKELPPLKAFILPGGHPVGASLHLCRSIIRRAERLVVPLYAQADVAEAVIIYLNRLSDYFFVVSRWVNKELQAAEIQWHPHKPTSNDSIHS